MSLIVRVTKLYVRDVHNTPLYRSLSKNANPFILLLLLFFNGEFCKHKQDLESVAVYVSDSQSSNLF